MRVFKMFIAGLLITSLLAPPVEARRHRRSSRNGLAAAAAVGVIAAVATNRTNRRYYGNRYYGNSYHGNSDYGGYSPYRYGYGSSYGYAAPYVPVGPLPFGATSYVDEGNYRNFRDAYGNYLGRIPLSSIY